MSKIDEVFNKIEQVVGSEYVTNEDFMKAAYSRNVDPAFPDKWADIIVRPETTEEVSEIVKIANKYKIPIVPRGGGADLVSGSVSDGGILLDLTRMNRIIEINEIDFYCVVECGITWGELVSVLHEKGLTTGILGPGSGYSATIGGGLSNSTAGFGSTKYGLVPDICLGVEVVLGDGTIINTGSAANQYAKPFCRYGVAPDFTGLFMGDVGTMGIKTKAFLRLFPLSPIKVRRDYMFKKSKWTPVPNLIHTLQTELKDALSDAVIIPHPIVVSTIVRRVKNQPDKRPRITGHIMIFYLEAHDQRIMDVYLEKLDEIMTKDNLARRFEYREIDLDAELSDEMEFNLKLAFNFFNDLISIVPGMMPCTTCHKVPVSKITECVDKSNAFDKYYQDKFPDKSGSLYANLIDILPNGHVIFVGGFTAFNRDDQHEIAMEQWHRKLRVQVRYGAAHYWLGESISQSIVEAGAFTPEFARFFKDMKKTVDPNFILSPKKFHMYSSEDDISKYLVEVEDYMSEVNKKK